MATVVTGADVNRRSNRRASIARGYPQGHSGTGDRVSKEAREQPSKLRYGSGMRISVNGSNIELLEPDVFTAFDVVAPNLSADQVLTALGGHGSPSTEPDHVFVAIAAVRSMAGDAADRDWEEQFQAMIAYAASKGWLNDAGDKIMGHLAPN